jgi:Tol biopolymer transport system component
MGLSACSTPATELIPSATISITPDHNPTTLSPTIILSPSATPTLTWTPTPFPTFSGTWSPTQTLTSRPVSPIIWGDWLGTPVVIEDFHGYWSPTANALVGVQAATVITGTLALSGAPDFTLQPFHFEQAEGAIYNPSWSPDGQSILFGAPNNNRGGFILDIWSKLWVIDRNGSNLRLLPGNFRAISFPFWMDRTTVVVTSYSGGGHESVSEINYLTGEELVDDTLNYFFMGMPQGGFLPVNSGEDYNAHILTRVQQVQPPLCQENCYTVEFPRQQINASGYPNTYFEDWLPGRQVALINVFRGRELATRLFLWDLATNDVSTLIPGGISAHFSRDGQNLLFTTMGPYSLYTSTITSELTLDPISDSGTIYLQLMDFSEHKVLMSLPSITWDKFWDTPRGDFNVAWFSPDGHYLAFQSLGSVVTGESGWPSAIDSGDTAHTYLNILDLRQKKLIYSFPAPHYWREISWAPTSDKLIFRNLYDEWMLIDLSTMELLPITVRNGWQISENPTWSYDGHYLSLTTRLPIHEYDPGLSMNRTYVFNLSQPRDIR